MIDTVILFLTRHIFFSIVLLLSISSCAGLKASTPFVAERPDWVRYFNVAGVAGTMVLVKEGAGRTQVYDPVRSAAHLLPASTFKILNSCIAIETGVTSGPDEVFPWDGVKHSIDA